MHDDEDATSVQELEYELTEAETASAVAVVSAKADALAKIQRLDG